MKIVISFNGVYSFEVFKVMLHDEIEQVLWAFVRGDLHGHEFELLIYNEENKFDTFLNSETYLELISNNYRNYDDTIKLKKIVADYLQRKHPHNCSCLELKDFNRIGMGHQGNLFDFLKVAKERGEAFWWIKLLECRDCSQGWLIGEEQTNYDDYYLKRLSKSEIWEIKEKDNWPSFFDNYETLSNLNFS